MDDYISMAAAIDAMEQAKEQYFDRRVIIGKMQDIVNNLPSAQPEIIRCRDCVYKPCKMMPYSYDDDFCSYAERRTDERSN